MAVFIAALLLCAFVTKSHCVSWNDASRFATVEALSQRGTFAIERTSFAKITLDKYRYRGHWYSDKSPLLPLQGAVAAPMLGVFGFRLEPEDGVAIYAITLFSVGFWFALGVAYLYALQRKLGASVHSALLTATLAAFGTPALTYATVFVNHVPAAAAVIAAIYHLVRARNGGVEHSIIAALFVSTAIAFDAAAFSVVVAAAILLWRAPRLHAAAFALVVMSGIAAQAAFNVAVSGSPLPPAFDQRLWTHGTVFHVGYLETPVLQLTPLAVVRNAWAALAGDKGIVVYMPLVLTCIAGFAMLWRERSERGAVARAAACACIAYYVVVVLYHDYGSVNFGERRYADVAFLLCVPLGCANERLRAPAWNLAARIAAALSVTIAALGTVAPFAATDRGWSLLFALEEFVRLTRRAPLQAGLDVAALTATIALLMWYWPRDTLEVSPAPRAPT